MPSEWAKCPRCYKEYFVDSSRVPKWIVLGIEKMPYSIVNTLDRACFICQEKEKGLEMDNKPRI